MEETLTKELLTADEVWHFEGSLQWWRKMYVTTTLPAAIVLAISGTAMLVSQYVISRFEKMGT